MRSNASVFLKKLWIRASLNEFYTEALDKYADENAINPEAERKLVRRTDRLMIPLKATYPSYACFSMSTNDSGFPLRYLVPKPIYIFNSEFRQCVLVSVELINTS
ncbi:hypothetical protein K435DRAFT_779726 [Dendrothele bispora CBS 962.96]|uniref:Uncharacterized protein n=1 Tax=Dendrothele bispora (strain CBS 962.96) TaxID=1314807 RepID=A0A4S8LVS1_DENBC|nr:hypothetical protein K435DRAFT_779726 [Dendrothele bispora CBS 962.96]